MYDTIKSHDSYTQTSVTLSQHRLSLMIVPADEPFIINTAEPHHVLLHMK